MPRLFVAVSIPPAQRKELASLRDEELEARWVAEDNYHITVRFIGDVEAERVPAFEAALAEVQAPPLAKVTPREMSVRGSGLRVFPSYRKPRVLVVRVERDENTRIVQEDVERVLQEVGLQPETRPFRPHITIARFRRVDRSRVRSFVNEHDDFGLTPFLARGFTLLESKPGPRGPTYEAVAHFEAPR